MGIMPLGIEPSYFPPSESTRLLTMSKMLFHYHYRDSSVTLASISTKC